RAQLPDIWRAIDLAQAKHGSIVRIAGNVICRQRPGTAKGFVFISLEDETGVSNAIVTPDLFEETRLLVTEEPFLVIEGEVQNTDTIGVENSRLVDALIGMRAEEVALRLQQIRRQTRGTIAVEVRQGSAEGRRGHAVINGG